MVQKLRAVRTSPSEPAGRRQLRGADQIPGPQGWPLLGQLPEYMSAKFFPGQLTEWANKYGGLYKITFPGSKYIVVTDPALVPVVTQGGLRSLPKTADSTMWDTIATRKPHQISGLFTRTFHDSMHKTVKRGLAPAFSATQLRQDFPRIALICQRLCQYLQEKGDGGSTAVDVMKAIQLAVLDMMGTTQVGVDFGCLQGSAYSQYSNLITKGQSAVMERHLNPWRIAFPWFFPSTREEEDRVIEALLNFWAQLLQEARARPDPGPKVTPAWAQLLRLQDPVTGGSMSDDQLMAEIASLIVGGTDSTAFTLTWALFALTCCPEKQERLLAELEAAGLVRPGHSGLARQLTFDDLSSLPYLDAVINETLRLYHALPVGTTREVMSEPLQLGEYEVPPGWKLWIPFWALHRSQHTWEHADEFVPERWLNSPTGGARCPFTAAVSALGSVSSLAQQQPQASMVADSLLSDQLPSSNNSADAMYQETVEQAGRKADASSTSSSSNASSKLTQVVPFAPFGNGPRYCVGANLAMMEMRMVLIHIISTFRLELATEYGSQADVLERMRAHLLLQPGDALHMYCRARGSRHGTA